MEWVEYELNYKRAAAIRGKGQSYIYEHLEYAKRLYDQQFPIIYSQEHFCRLAGYDTQYVYAASNQPESFYRTFYIRKKNGKKRRIDEPLPSLKEIQNWIYKEILVHVKVSPYAKAFVKGKSVKENARFHRKQCKVLTMDIKDFFGSISFGRVLHVFRKIGYKEEVAVMLANLCCLKGSLPQGAPTSPALSNIIASQMDYQIVNDLDIRKGKIRYTRYADDMTFSGDFHEGDVIKIVERIAKNYGFTINQNKTRVRRRNQRQEVTGIVVNEKLQLSRTTRKRIRSDMYYIEKYGLENHIEHIGENRQNYLYHLIGLISYGIYVNPHDEELKRYGRFLRNR